MFLVIVLLLIFWFSLSGFPAVMIKVKESYDFNSDIITRTKHQHCTTQEGFETESMVLFGILIGILTCYLVGLIVKSISKQTDKSFFNKTTIWSSYCVVPSFMAVFLVISINLSMDVTFYVVVFILYFPSFGLLTLSNLHYQLIEKKKRNITRRRN